MMELETGCSRQASRFVCRAVCCTMPVYKLGHTRELRAKKETFESNNLYIYIYKHHCSLTRSNIIRLENFHSFDFYSSWLEQFIPPDVINPPPLFRRMFLARRKRRDTRRFLGDGFSRGMARIFLSTTLNVPWNDAATLATTRFCADIRRKLSSGYRYTGDPLSCRMSRWKMRLLSGWTRNRSSFHDFTSRLSTDKPWLRKFFSSRSSRAGLGNGSVRFNLESLRREFKKNLSNSNDWVDSTLVIYTRYDTFFLTFFSFETILWIFSQQKLVPSARILL